MKQKSPIQMPRRAKPAPDSPKLFPERIPGRITIFDLETTGLDVRQGARTVEICAVRLDDGVETGRLETLLNPGIAIPRDATEIHKITNSMIKGFPSLDDILPDFLTLAEGGILAAYNISFDISFIDDAAVRKNLAIANPLADLILLARQIFPGHSSYKLWNVRNIMGLEHDSLHRAAADVAVCLTLWLRWVEIANNRNHADAVERALQLSSKLMRPDRRIVEMLYQIIDTNGLVEILYEGNQGTMWRKISPQKIVTESGTLVLKGFCHLRNADRTFALYRVRDIKPSQV